MHNKNLSSTSMIRSTGILADLTAAAAPGVLSAARHRNTRCPKIRARLDYSRISADNVIMDKGRRKKSGTFGLWGPLGVRVEFHFLFLLPFDAEAFKTCKNTIKLINLCDGKTI